MQNGFTAAAATAPTPVSTLLASPVVVAVLDVAAARGGPERATPHTVHDVRSSPHSSCCCRRPAAPGDQQHPSAWCDRGCWRARAIVYADTSLAGILKVRILP